MREIKTSITTAVGDLRALVRYPDTDRLLPGLVLVDGSGDGAVEDAGQWPTVIGDCGAVVLTHDKPGSGGSPGDWRDQSIEDRATESLAAVEVLRRQPGVDPDRVGLLGVSQGGWVAYLAASLAPGAVHRVAAISGPGVTVAEQERYRLATAVENDAEAMAWVDERTRRYLAGEDTADILADQRAYRGRSWFDQACDIYDIPELQPFLARNLGFDPAAALRAIQCPVFAAFGGADPLVPVARSVALLNELLPTDPRHALVVFSRADHNLFIAEPDRAIPLASQLAPGYLPMLTDWLAC